ncbi:MAG: hypothetical protein IJ819_10200 [Clostridiales bacterium]|nr:hypothetical protein [Clostridiales bacterium]
MVYDVFAGLSEEYKEYRVIEPQQLNFREAANDSERMTAADLRKDLSKDSKTLFICGAIIIALGVLFLFSNLGGVLVIMFGALIFFFGIMKFKKGKDANLVATGILLKKDSYTTGAVHKKDRHTYRWLVIDVDGMEKTLCTIHANPRNFAEAHDGDRILVINDRSIHYGKKIM